MFVCYATLPRHFAPRAPNCQGFIYDPHGRVIYYPHGRVATVFFFEIYPIITLSVIY